MSGTISVPKVVFITVKVLLIIIMMLMGMRSHYTRTNRINSVFKLFIFYIFLMLLLCIYEFIFSAIALLYVILVLSGIGKLAGVLIFVEKAKHFQDPSITKTQRRYIWFFYSMFFCLLCLTPFPVIGAFCTPRFTYPICFMMYLYTEVCVFMFTTKLYINDYYLDELRVLEIDSIEEGLSATLKLNTSSYSDSE